MYLCGVYYPMINLLFGQRLIWVFLGAILRLISLPVRFFNWWPSIHVDAQHFVQNCDVCQRQLGQPFVANRMPFHLVLTLEPFQKWGLDFVVSFKPVAAHTGNKYILTAKDYATEWVKDWPLWDNKAT